MAIIKISVFKFLPYLFSFIDYLFHEKWIFEPLKLQIYPQKCLSGIMVMVDIKSSTYPKFEFEKCFCKFCVYLM